MTRTTKVGPAGSFGARYGTVTRRRYTAIVSELRKRSECPRCHVMSVKREAVGIWNCAKCGYKFAGGAYVAQTKLGEIARRAAKGAAPKKLAAELGLIEAPKEAAQGGAEPQKRRTRRRKTPEAPQEESE